MCGRYSVLTEDEIIEVRSIIQDLSFRLVQDDLENYESRPGDVCPTDSAPIITSSSDGIAFERAKFGFKKWDGKGVIINARSETVKDKKMFSNLLSVGRCVVPAGEYYEWKEQSDGETSKGKKKKATKKVKHFIKDKEGNLLFFAGLYRDGDDGREFVIITKNAFGDVTGIHDRMPVILKVSQLESWLSGELSPDEITAMDFDASVATCEDENSNKTLDNENVQLNLHDY